MNKGGGHGQNVDCRFNRLGACEKIACLDRRPHKYIEVRLHNMDLSPINGIYH